MTSNGWRPILAALANPDTRRVIAHLIVGMPVDDALAGLSASKQRRVRDALTRSGLVEEGDGAWRLRAEAFADALAEEAPPARTGVERFLDGTRIVQFPASLEERDELLGWVLERVLRPGEIVDEPTLNERLAPFTADVALLRRYLVDFGHVSRR